MGEGGMAYMFRKKREDVAVDLPPAPLPTFNVQAFFIRTKGAGNTDSWPDVLTWRTKDGKKSVTLRRDKPCCYISTDSWSIDRRTVFEVCDDDDVWLTCVLVPADKGWTLERRMREDSETKETQPRWEMNIEVSLVGKVRECPCFLQENAFTTRRICRGKGSSSSLKAIDEDGVIDEEAVVGKEGVIVPDFSERFLETYKSLGGTGSLTDGESGD